MKLKTIKDINFVNVVELNLKKRVREINIVKIVQRLIFWRTKEIGGKGMQLDIYKIEISVEISKQNKNFKSKSINYKTYLS